MPAPTSDSTGSRPHKSGSRSAAQEPRLEERPREELYELARQLGIAGFSEMSKGELVEAIRRR